MAKTLMQTIVYTLFAVTFNAYAVNFSEPYLNQSNHQQTLVHQGWDGAHIRSIYVDYTSTVIFEYCGPSGHRQSPFKICRRLHRQPLPWASLDHYQTKLKMSLSQYRRSLVRELDSHWLTHWLGGSSADTDVLALDDFISAIEAEPLKYLILEGPTRPVRQDFSSLQVLKAIAHLLETVLSVPPPIAEPKIAESRITGKP